MKFLILTLVLTALVIVECRHLFVGTNMYQTLVHHQDAKYHSKMFQKTVEYFNYTLPSTYYGRTISGILAYDVTNSGASANITAGGTHYNFVNLRMKSDRGKQLHYDIYIYA